MTKIRVKRGLSENLDSVSIEGEKMNKIKFRRGSLNNKKNIDIEDGEPIYLTDTKRLYVSNEDVAINNVYVGSQEPNDPGINVWIDPQGVNNVIDMIYPIGSIYISATNTDPSSTFGGTWELVDKEFKPFGGSMDDAFTINTTNVNSGGIGLARSGHTIFIRLQINNKVALTDTTLDIGTIDWSKMGFDSLTYGLFDVVGASDGGQAIVIARIQASGEMETRDVHNIDGSHSVDAGSTIYWNFSYPIEWEKMSDSACDKFYWKRVS